MEQCEAPSGHEHPWKAATMKRRAWAQSRDSWQAPDSQDVDGTMDGGGGGGGSPVPVSAEPMEEKSSAGPQEAGRIPNNIASWLQECRSPLGASLDEQGSSTPTKGVLKNGCSFEDDLSLGAEANHLLPSGTKAEVPCYGVPAKEKRSQFKQKGRSMNSTGSGKSNATVSSGLSSLSVSELLDLCEEDPEEILYNLGFGREEPNISSKVPSRFFNCSSTARGIDFKVYLNAQAQRMELENPSYALTSRFRQIEVLTTVANAFSSLYSQVSGLPVAKIGNNGASGSELEGEGKETPPVARSHSSSTLNAVKMLKKSLTRHNLLAGSAEGNSGTTTSPALAPNSEPGYGGPGGSMSDQERLTVAEYKLAEVKPQQQKGFRKKEPLPLATVAEEAQQSSTESLGVTVEATDPISTVSPCESSGLPQASVGKQAPLPSLVLNGALVEGDTEGNGDGIQVSSTGVLVSISQAEEDGEDRRAEEEQRREADIHSGLTSTPDKEPTNLLPNPLLDHLRTSPQARESFEMDELQEDEPGTRSGSRAGSELLRTASQQSDSSGFAEDPSTDCSANYLKVQDSSDSCDSETTVTSHAGDSTTPLAADTAAFELDSQASLQSQSSQTETEHQDELEYNVHQLPKLTRSDQLRAASFVDQPTLATTSDTAKEAGLVLQLSTPMESLPHNESASVPVGLESMPKNEIGADPACPQLPNSSEASGLWANPSSSQTGSSIALSEGASEKVDEANLGKSNVIHEALQRAQERSSPTSEQDRRVGRATEHLRKCARLGRNPLQRSSSLPTSLLSPSRVVSSLRVQLGHGSVRHCSPPSFSYRYTPEPEGALEVGSIQEEGHSNDEEEVENEHRRPSCQTTLIINSCGGRRATDPGASRTDGSFPQVAPHPFPLLPSHLNVSTSSLHSGHHLHSHHWPNRPLAEGGAWSSVPNLSLAHHAASSLTQHHYPYYHHPHQQSQYPVWSAAKGHGSPLHSNAGSSLSSVFSQSPFSPSPSPFFPPAQTPFYTPSQGSAPYGLAHGNAPYSSPYHPPGQGHPPQQQLSEGHFNSPIPSYSPIPHPHSAPYMPYGTPPPGSLGQPYNPQHSAPPAFNSPHEAVPTLPTLSSTEMQLRRVLHEIRGTVQNLAQGYSPQPGDSPSSAFSPHRSPQSLYEELQQRKRSLGVFRSQMMDLELALMRQQSQVYQHLSQEERLEAEQLQQLRGAVRQELQELELQVEDRLLCLSEQLRAPPHPGLYRHPLAMHRGQSLDSMSNASALEPVSDLLREQLYLQSELGYEGGLSCTPTPMSGRSSGTTSPIRASRASGSSSPQRGGGLFRATVNLTPASPSRSGLDPLHAQPSGREENRSAGDEEEDGGGSRGRLAGALEPGKQAASTPGGEEKDGVGPGGGRHAGENRGADNPHLQQLIKEIKDSIADEIRQEIVSELLAAVSPRRPLAVSKDEP